MSRPLGDRFSMANETSQAARVEIDMFAVSMQPLLGCRAAVFQHSVKTLSASRIAVAVDPVPLGGVPERLLTLCISLVLVW